MGQETKFTFNMTSLQHDHIKMKDSTHVENLIQKFKTSGKQDLLLIVDFDRTITKGEHEGKKCDSSYGVITSSPILGEDYKTKCEANDTIYYAIEIDPKLSAEEKTPYMIEWFEKNNSIMCTYKVHRTMLPTMVDEAHVVIRDEFNDMCKELCDAQVPTLIYSAGLGDIVLEIMNKKSQLLPNMHVVSNMLNYTEDGYIDGLKGDLIHMFNKNAGALRERPLFKTLQDKHCVIVLGDMEGDADMAKGLEGVNVLKIGFLNDKVDERLPGFLAKFDIVLVNDQTMCIPHKIVSSVIS